MTARELRRLSNPHRATNVQRFLTAVASIKLYTDGVPWCEP